MDPFEPVRHARITELLAEQTDVPAVSCPPLHEGSPVPEKAGILVFDATDEQDLVSTGRCLFAGEAPQIMAGCAGFAAVLPRLLGLAGIPAEIPRLDPRLLVLCGSVNPITLRQLDKAEKAGFARMRLTPYQKLTPGYWESQHGREALSKIEKMLASNGHCIIETNDAGSNQLTADYAAALGIDRKTIRVRISGSVGHLLGAIFTSPHLGTLLLTGGDTLLQCICLLYTSPSPRDS